MALKDMNQTKNAQDVTLAQRADDAGVANTVTVEACDFTSRADAHRRTRP
jgi:hypothetical protein